MMRAIKARYQRSGEEFCDGSIVVPGGDVAGSAALVTLEVVSIVVAWGEVARSAAAVTLEVVVVWDVMTMQL